jgi:hypothetical protein
MCGVSINVHVCDGHSVIKLIAGGSFFIDVEIFNDVQHSTYFRCM